MKKQSWLLCMCMVVLQMAGRSQNATEIVRKADEKLRGNTSETEMTIQIVRPTWNREMQMKSWSKGDDYALILITSPTKDAGTVFLKRNTEVWNWVPSIERNVKLPPSMMSQSWMGTDFTNDDLVKEMSVVNDYTHRIIKEENLLNRACWQIEMIPKPGTAIVWGKVLVWIDKTDYMQLKAEYYDEEGFLVNSMVASEIKTLGGKILPSKMEMIPADKPGNKTVLIYNAIHFEVPIADNFFTVDNMRKVK